MLGVMGLIGMAVLTLLPVDVPDGAEGFLQRGPVWPTGSFLWWTFVQAAGSLLGVGMIIKAYQMADASKVSVFEYIILPASAAWGFLPVGRDADLACRGRHGADRAGGRADRRGVSRRPPRASDGGKGDVGLVPADHHLIAILQRASVGAFAHDHRGLLAAMADRADLAHLVGPGQQGGGTGEEVALEVHPQAVSHDRHAQVIDRAGQLPDLGLGQELRLVDEDAGHGAFRKPRLQLGEQDPHPGPKVSAASPMPMRLAMRPSPARLSNCAVIR